MAETAEYDKSGLVLYSLGTVAANKKRKSKEIEVITQEAMPMMDGELTDNTEEYKTKGEGVDGENAFDNEIKTTASVKATWMPLGITNRKTAPDVRRGEKVLVYRYKDTDKFYWVEYEDSPKLRRLETVTYAWGNEREENKELDNTNTYFFEISTHDKFIHLRTNKNDKEPFAYDIQLNTKEGFFQIQDDDGNYFFLDSKKRHIRAENKDKSFLELKQRIINIKSADEINLETKKYSLKASESITERTKTHTYRSNSYTLTTSSYELTSNSYKNTSASIVNTGTITHNGDVRVNGNHHTSGNSYEGSSSGPGNSR